MDLINIFWAITSFFYIGTMSAFAFVLGICNSRIAKKTFLKNTLWIIIALYILSFVFLRLLYRWHFLLETILLMVILLSWVAGRKCQLAGLTGGIACGKSTAAEIMLKQKLSIIDCDEVAHRVIQRLAQRIAKAFPFDDVLTEDGSMIDFKKLGPVVFANKAKLRKLNSLTHWRIGLEILKEILYRKFILWEKYVIVDMPLLFETKLFAYICYPIVLVYMDNRDLQISRIVERKKGELTREDAVQRINSQMSLEYKKKNADVLINNEGTVEDLEHEILSKLFPLLLSSIE